MDLTMTFTHMMITVGTIFLLIGIIKSLKIKKKVPKNFQSRWKAIIILMVFFLFGYIIAILILLLEIETNIIIGMAFLGGAIYVAIIITLSSKTINALVEKEKLATLNMKLTETIYYVSSDYSRI